MRIYGPVPSRRFGLSLGVDLLPRKTCPFDCIYCQVGPTDKLTATMQDFYSIDEIVDDIAEAIEEGPEPDLITFAGSGEPTLYESLGPLIHRIKGQFDIPVLLITNSSMLWKDEVAEAIQLVDILAPSLDAGDEETYRRLNKPHPDVTFDRLIKGLANVTHRFGGEIRLEVMLVRGVNDSDKSLHAIAGQLEKLRFDQVDVNTPVRPPLPERGALPCYQETLDRALKIFGPKARAIGKFEKKKGTTEKAERTFSDLDKDIRETLLRRPSTKDDIATALGLDARAVECSLKRLVDAGLVDPSSEEGGYYRAKKPMGRSPRS